MNEDGDSSTLYCVPQERPLIWRSRPPANCSMNIMSIHNRSILYSFCTQSPDYPLPTTACLIQERLGLGSHVGALDFNLGCSGFVYGLSLADGLIQSGQAKNVLLLTGETYSKYIDQQDRSLRTIFGDAAAATLVTAREQKSLNAFRFGTDGSGADTLLVTEGGHRPAEKAHQPRHRKRWASRLYMDGPSLISFTVGAVPKLIDQVATLDGRKTERL